MLYKNIANLIKTKKAKVAVMGLGYVGLPLAKVINNVGYNVTGIDIDTDKINKLLAQNTTCLCFTDQIYKLRDADIVIICVPTPLCKTQEPDMSCIQSAINNIINYMQKETLIVLESTTYPGTTDELIVNKLEQEGFVLGSHYALVFSPERIDPGNKKFNLINTPKIVGGVTSKCTKLATLFYKQFIKTVVPVSNARTAEMVKLLENTFRAVNIGLANELALLCDKMGLNIWEIIDAAKTKPYGFMPFYPGPGLGGHCLPIDPLYLSWKAKTYRFNTHFIDWASEINRYMSQHVCNKIVFALNQNSLCVKRSSILILGVAYKRDSDDVRESPALDIIKWLINQGARVDYFDPYVPQIIIDNNILSSLQTFTPRLYDCVVVVTDHTIFKHNYKSKKYLSLIVDTRNLCTGKGKNWWTNSYKIISI